VGGGTGSEGSALDASFVFDGGDDFEFAFGELMDLDQTCGFGPLAGEHELGRIWNPLDFVRSVIERSVEVLDDLWGVCGLHSLELVRC
jgi:hypothetical protein